MSRNPPPTPPSPAALCEEGKTLRATSVASSPASSPKSDEPAMNPQWPALWLEQERLGETSAWHESRRAALTTLQVDELKTRVAALAADDAEILARYPAPLHLHRIAASSSAKPAAKSSWPTWSWWLPAAGMAVAVVMVWRSPSTNQTSDVIDEGATKALERPVDDALEATRIKGLKPHLVVYRQEDGQATRVAKQQVLPAKTLIQLAYVPGGCKAGSIVSVDGAGQVTLHYPEHEGASALLEQAAGEVSLQAAYELDHAPNFERFFFVCAAKGQEFNVLTVVKSAHKVAPSLVASKGSTGDLEVPAGWLQSSFLIRKVDKP